MKYLVVPAAFLLYKAFFMAVTVAIALSMALWAGSNLQPAISPQNGSNVQLAGGVEQAQPTTLNVGQNVQSQ